MYERGPPSVVNDGRVDGQPSVVYDGWVGGPPSIVSDRRVGGPPSLVLCVFFGDPLVYIFQSCMMLQV